MLTRQRPDSDGDKPMFLRRLAFWTFWIIIALYVLRDPAGAADTAAAIGRGLAFIADGLARFASALL